MILTRLQITHILINIGVILLGVGLTFLAIRLTKLKEKQTKLIFILYMIYWIPTLICRDYTGLMSEHIGSVSKISNVFYPLLVYGLIGLIWRPVTDLLSFKMKSRRNIIFISLGLQLLTFIPFIVVPNETTNIIQSIGCGIGASCIGLFNLMFDDQESKRTVFNTVSILSIPPILAQFFASAFESIFATQVPIIYTHTDYLNTMIGLWVVSIVLIVVAFIIAIFIKPRPKLLYVVKKRKSEIKTKHNWIAFLLICFIALFLIYFRWTTTGPTTGIQLTYISSHFGTDARYYEGYTGLICTAGQLIGTIIAGYALVKAMRHESIVRILLVVGSCVTGWMYCILAGFFVNVASFMGLFALAGLSYGLLYPVIIGIAVQKVFVKNKYVTPIGILNTFLAIGIVFGTFVVTYFKAPIFDQIHGFSTYSFDDFKIQNWHIMIINIVFIFVIMAFYGISYWIHEKHPEQKVTHKKDYNLMGDTEM